jgi:hypothetical protein
MQRFLTIVAFLASIAIARVPAHADIFAELFPLTGEVQLKNKDASPIPFVYYSITSSSGALNPASSVWKSITENYDAPFGTSPGNGYIDPTGEWIKLSAVSTQLTEGALGASGGSLAPMRGVSLGTIWNPHKVAFPDLAFDIRQDGPGGQQIPVTIELALAGDYLPNGVVDQSDYNTWRQWFGSTSVLIADGNLNGVVDTADYTLWRDNLGKTLPLPPYSTGGGASAGLSAASTPEPTMTALLLGALGLFYAAQSRRR